MSAVNHPRWAPMAMLIVLSSCAAVLGLRDYSSGPFEHRAHVTSGIRCAECHTRTPSATEYSVVLLPSNQSCLKCHEEPHDTRDCSACHGNPDTRHLARQARHYLRFAHNKHVDRMRGNCVRCHVGVAEDDHTLLPKMATCLSCHEHNNAFANRDCGNCHEDLPEFVLRPRSHVPHAPNFVKTHGPFAATAPSLCSSCHRDTFCTSCHGATVPALSSRLDFDRPTLSGLHRAGFKLRHSLEAKSQPGLCVGCHSQSSCQTCHEARGISSGGGPSHASPHPQGWTGGGGALSHGPAARLDPMGCASCHGGPGEALCVGCHRVGGAGGNIHPPGWTSPRPLTEVPCRRCHEPAS